MQTIEQIIKSTEHRNWIGDKCNLSLEELIEKPNCEMQCPDGFVGCPECKKCAVGRAFWRSGEKTKRFTKEEINMLHNLWNDEKGFLQDDGCILSKEVGRRFMPIRCLKHICINCKLSPYLRN